jgi:hypothetical protein
LSRKEQWLVINAVATEKSSAPPRIEVLLDGNPIHAGQLPFPANTPADAEPLVVPLGKVGREALHAITVRQVPGARSSPVVWHGITISGRHPALLRLLEDDLPQPGLEAVTQAAYSGSRCLRVGGGERVDFPVSTAIAIRATGHPGEYRFVRFAFRQQGQGDLRIELHRTGVPDQPLILSAGPNSKSDAHARSVWSDKLPDRWVVVTRDLYRDFGSSELRGITLSNPGTGSLLFDHFYFARRQSDFDLIAQGDE